MKARIPILLFLFLALILSCKSTAQSGIESPVPAVTPDVETPVSESSEPEEIEEIVDTIGIDEEEPPGTDIDAEDGLSEELDESEETAVELEQPDSEIVETEEIPEEPEEEPEIEEAPEIAEAPIEEEEQEPPVEAEEESVPLPPVEPTPSEQPPIEPQVVQPPPAEPPVQTPTPPSEVPPPPEVMPPPVVPQLPAPPAQQSPVPATPRDPPLPPPFLGPAEPERIPPAPQETFTPVVPELPSLPRDETPETQIVFSRVVRMTVGQMLEVPFRGTGWVYLGELGNRRGLSYDSRRLDIENGITIGQSFIFSAETAGTYILRFYRQDFIQDYIINDYVQVIVGEADDSARGRTGSVIDRGRIVAEPRWPSIPDVAGSSNETVTPPATGGATAGGATAGGATAGGATAAPVAETQRPDAVQAVEPASVEPAASGSTPAAPSQAAASPAPEVASPAEYVRRAQQEFDAGRVEQALAVLEQMRQHYPSGTDEAWWLLGQLYEANSPARDIRLSLEYYRRLVNEYPLSDRVDDARRRIAYLERYYFNIR